MRVALAAASSCRHVPFVHGQAQARIIGRFHAGRETFRDDTSERWVFAAKVEGIGLKGIYVSSMLTESCAAVRTMQLCLIQTQTK